MTLKADSHIACRAHAAKGLECVFPNWFTQCGRFLFTLAMPWPCHAPTMPFFSRPQHGRRETAVLWPSKERHGRSMAWSWHGKCESDTAALCKSIGKDILNPLRHGTARHGTAGERYAMCESALSLLSCCSGLDILCQWKYSTSHSKIPVFLFNILKNNGKFDLQEYAFLLGYYTHSWGCYMPVSGHATKGWILLPVRLCKIDCAHTFTRTR